MPTFTFEQIAPVAARVEVTRGVAETIVGSTDGFWTYNSPINSRSTFQRQEIRQHTTGFTKGLDIIGIRQNQPQFSFVMMGSGGAVDAVARWAPILRCSGTVQTVNAGVSVSYAPPATQAQIVALATATIQTEMDGTRKQHVGTQAESFTISAEAGRPWTASFRGRSIYAASTLATITGFAPGPDTSRPWLSPNGLGTAVSITPAGRTVHTSVAHAMNFDMGLRLVAVEDANTFDGLHSTWVVDQNPTLQLTIAYDKIATGTLQLTQIESDLTTSNVHNVVLENGGTTSAGQRVRLALPTAQLVDMEPITGNGLRRNRLSYKIQHATVGSEFLFTTL